MKIEKRTNKIFFNNQNRAYGNITIENDTATIELIKVLPEFRGKNLAASLLEYIIFYTKKNLRNIRKIELTPLPIDTNGLKINQLVKFYERHGFRKSYSTDRFNTNLMSQYIK